MTGLASERSNQAKLVVDDVSVAYGDNMILDRLSLEVAAGEIVAVVGPSGSGKSTLLRAIAGLEPLLSGRVLVDGVDLVNVPPHRRGVGLMFQDHALFAHLSVEDNIGYGLDREGIRGGQRQHRIDELLELVGLSGFNRRAIDELSGGEAQRVALARALAPSPSLLMFDEPLGSLDRVLRSQLVSDLDRLLKQVGQTAIHVTHDQSEAAALADRVAVLSQGRLVRVGSPRELWDDPGSRFVAEFLGRQNIWDLTVDQAGNLEWPAAGVKLGPISASLVTPSTAADVAPITVVVPDDGIAVADGADDRRGDRPDPSATLAAEVVTSQFHEGRFRHLLTLVDSGLELTMNSGEAHRPGERLGVVVDLGALIPLLAD